MKVIVIICDHPDCDNRMSYDPSEEEEPKTYVLTIKSGNLRTEHEFCSTECLERFVKSGEFSQSSAEFTKILDSMEKMDDADGDADEEEETVLAGGLSNKEQRTFDSIVGQLKKHA